MGPPDAGADADAPEIDSGTPIDSGTLDSGDAPDAEPPDSGFELAPEGWSEFGGMPDDQTRWGARMVLDPDEDRFLLFGGSQYPVGGTSDELWSFSIADASWTKIEATGDVPEPRYCHCVAYLPDQRQMLLVGGRDESGPLAPAAFILDLATNVWTKVAGPVPSGVIGCNVEWMPELAKAVVFGGGGRTGFDTVTWLFDPTSQRFNFANPDHTPPARSDAASAYDPINHRMLVFGGSVRAVAPYQLLSDTWAFDGVDWTEITGDHPSERRFGAPGVDPTTGSWFLFGGTRETDDFDEIWRFDLVSSTWTLLPVTMPPARGFPASAWHGPTGALYVFGGLGQPNYTGFHDGWRFRPE